MVLETDFDGLLEEDVIFEETAQTMEYADILKNSENMFKSFLYLKKLFNSTPLLTKIIKIETVDYPEETEYSLSPDTNTLMVKNVDNVNGSLFVDGGELILLPFESFEFPLSEGAVVSLLGKLSIVQSRYNVG